MKRSTTEGVRFEKREFSGNRFPEGDYEECRFVNCDMAGADLSSSNFIECVFEGCNLSLAKLGNTGFRDVRFKECKLMGLHFEECSPFLFAVEFDHCTLNLCAFYRVKMKGTKFLHCQLQEVDFTETDLQGAVFDECDLAGAIFSQSLLEKADFRTAQQYIIDPSTNRIKKARFSYSGILGLLAQHDIRVE